MKTYRRRFQKAIDLDLYNRDMEKAFDVSMSTIYKRSWHIRRLLGMAD